MLCYMHRIYEPEPQSQQKKEMLFASLFQISEKFPY